MNLVKGLRKRAHYLKVLQTMPDSTLISKCNFPLLHHLLIFTYNVAIIFKDFPSSYKDHLLGH